jgi:hypothetical protein
MACTGKYLLVSYSERLEMKSGLFIVDFQRFFAIFHWKLAKNIEEKEIKRDRSGFGLC